MKSNRLLLGVLMGIYPPVLSANCAPAVEALQKAWRIERLAQYDIESPDEPLTGRPFVIRIGKTVWTDLGDVYHRNHAPAENPMVLTMKGAKQCSAAGEGMFRGEAALKYRIDGALGGGTTGAIILWVSRARGLPVYHEFTKLSPGGYAWVYGESIKPPAGQEK